MIRSSQVLDLPVKNSGGLIMSIRCRIEKRSNTEERIVVHRTLDVTYTISGVEIRRGRWNFIQKLTEEKSNQVVGFVKKAVKKKYPRGLPRWKNIKLQRQDGKWAL